MRRKPPGALLGLMAAGQVEHPAVARGIAYLQQTQDASGLWPQDAYTGGGFRGCSTYGTTATRNSSRSGALARYRNLRRTNGRRIAHGM